MSADTLLENLEKAKQTKPSCYMAKCPGHEDRTASLSIRKLDDGRVLVHCFAGCSVEEVPSAAGLTFDALYPEKPIKPGKPERRPFPATDILRAIAFESSPVLIAAADLMAGQSFTEADRTRLALARSRIQAALTAGGIGQ